MADLTPAFPSPSHMYSHTSVKIRVTPLFLGHLNVWSMSRLMFTKFCQSRLRTLSTMAFLEKNGTKKKLHFAVIDQKLYPIFNTSWYARDLKFCMSEIISRKILTCKFDNFWCTSSSKKRVLYSSQAWFKICKILKRCYKKTTGSRIFRFYT